MAKEFRQVDWGAAVEEDCRQIMRLAVREDLGRVFDWTTLCLVPSEAAAQAAVVSRQPGIICGLRAAQFALGNMDHRATWSSSLEDGSRVTAGQTVATIAGPARTLLTAERIMLNLIGRLSGVATHARQYVDAVAGSSARIYDTRKTTPGWRLLEKYAAHCGGALNHRSGLYDAILIKDNHLALGAAFEGAAHLTPAEAVRRARAFLQSDSERAQADMIVEIEVDTLDQLREVLAEQPDLVLLDNMRPEKLREAVAIRNQIAPAVELEASGGVNLQAVAAIAATGVDRISVGAITHSAIALDVGLDWR